MNLEEHRLIEQCLHEFYSRGELAFETASRLSEYEEFMELRNPGSVRGSQDVIDNFFVLAHKYFVVFGLNRKVPLTRLEIMELQSALNLQPTGRYGLATARAVKALQQKLKTEELYKGPVDGLWNEQFEAAWGLHKGKANIQEINIEDFDAKYGYDPRCTILMPSLVESLWAPDSLWVGHEELGRFLARGKPEGLIIRIGLTFRNGGLVPVFVLAGGKFMEDIAWKIRTAKMLAEDDKEFTNAAKKLGEQLIENGVTPENAEEKANQLYTLYQAASMVFLFYGVVRSVTGKGAVKLFKEIIRKGPGETWDEVREHIYRGLGKSRLVILRKGTESFKLKPAAFKNYPQVRGVWKPKGELRLVEKSLCDSLRKVADQKSFTNAFKEWWLEKNPGKKWNPKWVIHHVKPLKWGGDNDFKNLAPILAKDHNLFTSFWNKLMQTIAGIGTSP